MLLREGSLMAICALKGWSQRLSAVLAGYFRSSSSIATSSHSGTSSVKQCQTSSNSLRAEDVNLDQQSLCEPASLPLLMLKAKSASGWSSAAWLSRTPRCCTRTIWT